MAEKYNCGGLGCGSQPCSCNPGDMIKMATTVLGVPTKPPPARDDADWVAYPGGAVIAHDKEPAEQFFVYSPEVIAQYQDLFCNPPHGDVVEVLIEDAGGKMANIKAQHMRQLQHWGKPAAVERIYTDIGVFIDPAAVAAAPAPPMMRDSGFICQACGNDRLSGDGDMREHCPSCGGKTKAMQIVDGKVVKGFL